MNSIKLEYQKLKLFCEDVFKKYGFTGNESEIITDVLLRADLYGIESHGVQRLARYRTYIEDKKVDVHAKPEIVFETPVSAVIDGHAGMGQLISSYAMKLAIEKAKKVGMAMVTVRNSNHYGIAGYYSQMACDTGFIGVSMTNSESIMVHTHARKALLGSNPIAVAIPAEPYPFYFDAATTVVPRGKIEVYSKLEKPLPGVWALDEKGKVTSDASLVIKNIIEKNCGGILPVGGENELSGGHKGYGYAMICEIFSAILSGGLTSNHHKHMHGTGASTCHFFMAVDPACFGDPESIKTCLSILLEELRHAPLADGETRIYTHGEKEIEAGKDRLKNGINVNIKTFIEMKDLCNSLNIDINDYFDNTDEKFK